MLALSLLRAYASTIGSAVVPIVLGSYCSIKPPKGPKPEDGKEEEAEEDPFDAADVGHLSSSDAMWLPIIASVVLLSLFLAFTYFDKDLINLCFLYYDYGVGTFMLYSMGMSLVKHWKGRQGWKAVDKFQLTLKRNKDILDTISFTRYGLFFVALAPIVTFFRARTQHYLLANLSATVMCFNALTFVKLDSFKTGGILLTGLFLYDIYFVFGTTVMVTVATSFEAPVKMVWPKEASTTANPIPSFTMLGLGDIIVPGFFIALAFRYDYSKHLKQRSNSTSSFSFPKPYFYSCMVAYVLGLITTIAIMHNFKSAQPALLYLSPACIVSVLLCAWARGELGDLWSYKDHDEQDSKEDNEGKKADKDSPEQQNKQINGDSDSAAVSSKDKHT